jgi:hypothetical protein
MLPDQDVSMPKPRPTAFLADLRKDPIRWRATLYGWIACFAQAAEFSTFAFYLPVLFTMVGASTMLGNNLVTMVLFSFARCRDGSRRCSRQRSAIAASALPASASYSSRCWSRPQRCTPTTNTSCPLRPRECCGGTTGTPRTA